MSAVKPTLSLAGSRILFLDSLRAIAVLLVVWGHIFLVGIDDPVTVGAWVPGTQGPVFTAAALHENISWKLFSLMAFTGINPGSLGVALFFIISGFVILRTIERTAPVEFLIQRFFRIFPTSMVAVVLVGIATYVYSRYLGVSQPHSIGSVITSGFALNYFNGTFPTTPVLWTLEVEVFFYLIMALAAGLFRTINYRVLTGIALGCFIVVALYSTVASAHLPPAQQELLKHFSTLCVHVSYMLIGSFIYKSYSANSLKTQAVFLASALIIYYLSYKTLTLATDHQNIGINLPSAGLALLLFIAALRINFDRTLFRPLNWIASISYPFYLVHVPLGWALLYWLAQHGYGINVAAIASTLATVLLAWGLHHAIELPSQRFGKLLSHKRPKAGLPPASVQG